MRDLSIDYAVFALIILISFSITLFRNVSKNNKQNSKSDYVLASDSSVATWPMLISIARGFLGVRVFLGYPSELFYRGCELWETLYGILLAFPLVTIIFTPIFMNIGITSVYQYLDMRFKSKLVRCLASATYIVRSLLILSVATFTPCIALKTVIGIPYYLSIMCMTFIAILFMLSGGFGSALMGDVVQGILMMLVCFIVIVEGTIEGDGPVNVIKTARERGRLNFFNFDLDPTKRATTVSALVGHLFISLSMYGCQQNYIQRYLSLRTEEKVNRILILSIPVTIVMFSLSWIVGLVILVKYVDCDPLKLGYIKDLDELFPFYLEDKFLLLPGFLGVILAVLFNGALSAIVSNINSIATVIWEDFFLYMPQMKKLSDIGQVRALKFISAICGFIVMGISFGVSHLSGIIEVSIIMISATSGPLLGVFILALFFPCANWKGTSLGMVTGIAVIVWMTIGAATIPKTPVTYLPTTLEQCTNDTFNDLVVQHRISELGSRFVPFVESPSINEATNISSIISDYDEGVLDSFYKITYLYYSVIGTCATVFVGLIGSLLAGSKIEDYNYSDELLHPCIRKLRIRRYHAPVSMEIR